MTGQNLHFRHAGKAVQAYVRDTFKDVLQMVDLPIEGLVVALSWVGKAISGKLRHGKRRERPLQVIRAMSMVNDHVLRDVGLNRSAISAINELSAEGLQVSRMEREVS